MLFDELRKFDHHIPALRRRYLPPRRIRFLCCINSNVYILLTGNRYIFGDQRAVSGIMEFELRIVGRSNVFIVDEVLFGEVVQRPKEGGRHRADCFSFKGELGEIFRSGRKI